jgi:hypothetical protein
VENGRLHFDLAEDSTEKDFREAIEDICDHHDSSIIYIKS